MQRLRKLYAQAPREFNNTLPPPLIDHPSQMQHAEAPSRHGTELPPPLFNNSERNHTPHMAEIDPMVARLQPTLCNECAALNLGRIHMDAMTYEWWAGPEVGNHPANRSLFCLKTSSDSCCCCEFMYTATCRSISFSSSERDDVQTRLHFARWDAEILLEIETAASPSQKLAQLRMVHCENSKTSRLQSDADSSIVDDWLPYSYWPVYDSPNSHCTIAQVVPETPDIGYTAGQIRSWQRECELGHRVCGKFNITDVPLPPRVLLIVARKSQIIVQLKDSAGQNGRYVALSYVWGDYGQFTLTSESEQSLRAGLKSTVFPKTICEAIELTHALGFRYLWIDALCIKQDLPSDWNAQSTLMGQIYGNAGLTIMAARSTGVQNGFLKPTAPCAVYCGAAEFRETVKPVFLTHSRRAVVSGHFSDPGPLDFRAWAFQEEYLSRRKVKFTSRQMEWHCQMAKFEEQERVPSLHKYRAQCTIPKFGILTDRERWRELVQRYSARNITYRKDRLPAISGVARSYAAYTDYTYLAGLWSGPDLIEFLLWFRATISSQCSNPADTQSPNMAPSWSWIAVDAPVEFKKWLRSNKHIVTKLDLNCSVTLKTIDTFGEVIGGHLEFSAPAIKTTIAALLDSKDYAQSVYQMDGSVFLQDIFSEHMMKRMSVAGERAKVYLDKSQSRIDYDNDKESQTYCAVLGYDFLGESFYGMYGIIVTPVSLPLRTFRRIGMFECLSRLRGSRCELDRFRII